MNWTLLCSATTLLLNALVLAFWKPWLSAYGTEKGKNLARKEDLNIILAEVRAITITQKEIEHKLTGDLWDRQMRWNQKRDVYAQLIEAALKMSDALAALPTVIKLRGEATLDVIKLQLGEELTKRLSSFSEGQSTLTRAGSLAAIFASDDCNRALGAYHRSVTPPDSGVTGQWAEDERKKLNTLFLAITRVAKIDIGLASSRE